MPKSKAKKAQPKRATRSGVETGNNSEDDIDEWIDSAKSPGRESATEDEDLQEPKTPAAKKSAAKKKKTKTPKENVNMKLPGAADQDDDEDATEGQGNGRRGGSEAKRYAKKVTRGKGGKSDLTSPSDLSRVSTAARSPAAEQDDAPSEQGENGEADMEQPLLTQEEEEEAAEADKEEIVTQQAAAAKDSAETLELASPEDFGMGGNDYESDEGEADPLAPPTAADSSEDEDQPADEDAAKKSGDQIDGLDSDDEQGANNGFDHDDDNDDGPDYNMVHDPETPEAVRAARAKKEKDKIEERKGRKKKRSPDSDTEATEDSSKATPKPKKGKRQKNKKRHVAFSPKGLPSGNRDYEHIPIGAFIEGSPGDDDEGPRRSKRAKVKPLEYWRNEKMEYVAHDEDGELGEAFGNMPVVGAIQKANPTPYKKKKGPPAAGGKKKTKGSGSKGVVEEEEEFDSRKLRKKWKYLDGQEAYLWDDVNEDTGDQKVISYSATMEGSNLPLPPGRRKSEGKVVGQAAQAFNTNYNEEENYVGYIMGSLTLPPKAIKDSESVGPCSQTFTVCRCQPKGLEVAYGDPDSAGHELDPDSAQRFLLSEGDMFRVPPGNSYRLENHSAGTEALLTWTIIRPKSNATDE